MDNYKTIIEPQRKTPIYGQYDVVVCGGGVAGIAAALSAARGGKKVLLLERMFGLGGLATNGLIAIYLPLCDGCGTQLCYGVSEELLRLSIRHGWEGKYPKAWLENGTQEQRVSTRFEVQYNPQIFSILVEQQVRAEQVDILYGTTVCGVQMDGSRLSCLLFENKSGRQAVTAGVYLDCTGDADISALCGAPTAQFANGNVLAAWYYGTENGEYRLHSLGVAEKPFEQRTNADEQPLVQQRFSGLNAAETSEMMQLSRAHTLQSFLAGGENTSKNALSTLATIPQLRMTRRICGLATMNTTQDHFFQKDSIGMIGDWRKRGPAYEIPFAAMRGPVSNLLTAGRCISVTDMMWDITRVIPACAVTGEAAGTAATLCTDFTRLLTNSLQERLRRQGVRLHLSDVGLCIGNERRL